MTLKQSEADFASALEGAFALYGWRYFHPQTAWKQGQFMTARTGHSGFVDYIAVRKGRILFIELKSEKGRVSAVQWEWIEALSDVVAALNLHPDEFGVYVFRPSDWQSVLEVLK